MRAWRVREWRAVGAQMRASGSVDLAGVQEPRLSQDHVVVVRLAPVDACLFEGLRGHAERYYDLRVAPMPKGFAHLTTGFGRCVEFDQYRTTGCTCVVAEEFSVFGRGERGQLDGGWGSLGMEEISGRRFGLGRQDV